VKRLLRLFLVLAVAGLVVGIPVTFSHARLALLWTLALPLGAVFVGLFLITYLFRNELARFDAENRAKEDAARHPPGARAHAAASAANQDAESVTGVSAACAGKH
jgi:hypothetical protein